jgi:hypothetical protein
MPDWQQGITTRSGARPRRKILVRDRWALALARRRRVDGPPGAARHRQARTIALAVAAMLLAAPLFAVGAGPIALAGLPAPPPPRCLATGVTAIPGLGARGREEPFTAFEQTPAWAPRWPRLWSRVRELLK